jgi:hypothetical protein
VHDRNEYRRRHAGAPCHEVGEQAQSIGHPGTGSRPAQLRLVPVRRHEVGCGHDMQPRQRLQRGAAPGTEEPPALLGGAHGAGEHRVGHGVARRERGSFEGRGRACRAQARLGRARRPPSPVDRVVVDSDQRIPRAGHGLGNARQVEQRGQRIGGHGHPRMLPPP